MSRYSFTIMYDGTNYAGWQVQPKDQTVQQVVRDTLITLTRQKVILHGSGRTDQGVHARGQVAHCDIEGPLDIRSIMKSLNAIMPDDIRVTRMVKVAPDFHSRRSATLKEYRYFIWDGREMPPMLRLYRTHIRQRLDVDAMNRAAKILSGKKDFAAFTANAKRPIATTVRDVSRLEVRRKGNEIVIYACANGFLYKMVRSLAGFLINVGMGRVKPTEARAILKGGTRSSHVPTAPAEGLFLWKVSY